MSNKKKNNKDIENAEKSLRKVLLSFVLIIIIIAIAVIIGNSSSGKKEAKVANTSQITKGSNMVNNTLVNQENVTSNTNTTSNQTTENKKVTVTQLSDGTKYVLGDSEIIKPDIVVGDNYFDTTMADISTNFNNYKGKTIEIEGLYFENSIYTFVGRYSTSNICPSCPTGYSYIEYEYHGDEKPTLVDSDSWIKIIGTLRAGFDENGYAYVYVDINSLEVMNEKGLETVSN